MCFMILFTPVIFVNAATVCVNTVDFNPGVEINYTFKITNYNWDSAEFFLKFTEYEDMRGYYSPAVSSIKKLDNYNVYYVVSKGASSYQVSNLAGRVSSVDFTWYFDYVKVDVNNNKKYRDFYTFPLFETKEAAQQFVNTGVADTTKMDTTFLPDGYCFNKNGGLSTYEEEATEKLDKDVPYPKDFKSVWCDEIWVGQTRSANCVWTPEADWDKDYELFTEVYADLSFSYTNGLPLFTNFLNWFDMKTVDKTFFLGDVENEKGVVSYTNDRLLIDIETYLETHGYDYDMVRAADDCIFYARNYYIDGDGKKHYSYWVKWLYGSDSSNPVDFNPDDDQVVLDENGVELPKEEYPTNTDIVLTENDDIDFATVDTSDFFNSVFSSIKNFTKNLNLLVKSVSGLPVLFSKLLSWLPGEMTLLFALGFSLVIMLRVFGR